MTSGLYKRSKPLPLLSLLSLPPTTTGASLSPLDGNNTQTAILPPPGIFKLPFLSILSFIMSARPVNLTMVVTTTPPPKLFDWANRIQKRLVMRNATLGCAMYLSDRGYILMQDRIGCIWVQHENSPVIVQPPGGITFNVSGDLLPYDKWLGAIQSTVRHQGRVPLDPEVPYVVSVLRLYCGYYQPGQPWTAQDSAIPAVIINGNDTLARVPRSQQLRALNPYVAQRCK